MAGTPSEDGDSGASGALWAVPGSDSVELVDEALRLAELLERDTGERPPVVAVAVEGIVEPSAVERLGADEVVTLARETGPLAESAATVSARAAALASLAEQRPPDGVLLPGTPDGSDVAVSTARRLRGGCVTECLLRVRDGELVAGRPAYESRAYAEVAFEARPAVVALDTEAVGEPDEVPDVTADRWRHEVTVAGSETRQLAVLDVPEQDLTRARRIVAGGYGLGDPDGFEVVEDLADAMTATLGSSRPPADEGWVPFDRQIGVTGKEIDAELYVPVAISGDPYHMRSVTAEYLVPINVDRGARIFNSADIGVVGDVYEYGPVIADAIRAARDDAGEETTDGSPGPTGTAETDGGRPDQEEHR